MIRVAASVLSNVGESSWWRRLIARLVWAICAAGTGLAVKFETVVMTIDGVPVAYKVVGRDR